MHPKSFTSKNTSHGSKYEYETIDASVKQMNNKSVPVKVFRSDVVDFVDYKKEAVLAYSPDGKVINTGLAQNNFVRWK